MNALVPARPLAVEQIEEMIRAAGFARSGDWPFTDGMRQCDWRQGDSQISVIVGARQGGTILGLANVAAPVMTRLSRDLDGEDAAGVIAAARTAGDPRAKIRTLGRLALTLYLRTLPTFDEAHELLLSHLTDADALVRWAAWQHIQSVLGVSRKSEIALAAAKERFAEFADPWDRMREACAQQEAGTLADAPTTDTIELERRAAAGRAAGQWQRVERAAEMWLAERPGNEDAAHYRALALAGLGEPLLALLWLAAAVHHLEIEIRVHRRLESRDSEAERERALRELAEQEQKLACWQEELRAVRVAAEALAEKDSASAAVIATLERWAKESSKWIGGSGAAMGAAAVALSGLLPGEEPLLRWLRISTSIGASDEDQAQLLREAGDSPWVWAVHAERLSQTHPDESERAYDQALRLLHSDLPGSPLAERIAHLKALAGARLTELDVLEKLMHATYKRGDWDAAAARADALVERDPDSQTAWQIRANARTFGLRHAEAVGAYDDALRELTRILGGCDQDIVIGDQRGQMEFNRACVLARLGQREVALEGLRRALKYNEKWAKEATTDDYFTSLWDDAEFLAIVRNEPSARFTTQERSPQHILDLLVQANHAMGELDATRAAQLAGQALALARLIENGILRVSAGLLAGYTTAARGDVEGGLALARTARAELDTIDNADPAWRAEQLGEYVSTLSLAGAWDEAEAACRACLDARVQVFGASSLPVALSLNQLFVIEKERGASSAVRAATLERATAVLRAVLAAELDNGEAHAQLANVALWRSELVDGDASKGVQCLEEAASAVEQAARLGARTLHIKGVLRATEQWLTSGAVSGSARERLREISARLTNLLFPDPAEREERIFWHRIRQDVLILRSAGHDDRAIAQMLSELLRGDPPEAVRRLGAFQGFAEHMARHMATYRTLFALAAMALSTAAANGDVMGAIEQLEGLILADQAPEEDDNEH